MVVRSILRVILGGLKCERGVYVVVCGGCCEVE
jgi:hypothetical protein